MHVNRSLKVIISYFSVCFMGCQARSLILPLAPYPDPSSQYISIVQKIAHPGKLAKRRISWLAGYAQRVGGFFATYAGYLQVSDPQGLIAFPRRHAGNTLYLLITKRITPIIMFAQTVSHWEINTGSPSAFFLIEQKTDPETNTSFINVTEQPLPENNQIPLETLILIANPQNMYVPQGITLIAEKQGNFIIPEIYIKKGSKVVDNSLFLLNLTHLFRPVEFAYEKEPTRYRKQFID